MGGTPDRKHGASYEEGIFFDNEDDRGDPTVDPAVIGEVRRRASDDAFRMKDGQGVLNPREVSVSATDSTTGLLADKLVAGTAIVLVEVDTLGVKTLRIDGNVGGGITEAQHKSLRDIIHFIDEGPGDGFASGAYKEILPSGSPFPTSVIWYDDNTKAKKLVEKTIERSVVPATNTAPTPIVWKMYDADGSTVLITITDAINYSGVFETSRTRTWA